MARKYKKRDKVNVYLSQGAKDAGLVLKRVRAKPYSYGGFDSYLVDGRTLPGYRDSAHPDADACVILDGAHSTSRG